MIPFEASTLPSVEKAIVVVFSPDGNVVASSSDDGTIWRWSVCTGELQENAGTREPLQLKNHPHFDGVLLSKPTTIAFSTDGNVLASKGIIQEWMIFWNAHTGVPMELDSPFSETQPQFRLSADDKWLKEDQKKILQLTDEASVAGSGNGTVAIGYPSGNVIILKFAEGSKLV